MLSPDEQIREGLIAFESLYVRAEEEDEQWEALLNERRQLKWEKENGSRTVANTRSRSATAQKG